MGSDDHNTEIQITMKELTNFSLATGSYLSYTNTLSRAGVNCLRKPGDQRKFLPQF